MTKKQNELHVDPEFGVDSRYSSNEQRKQESMALLQGRLDRMKNLPEEQIIRAKLLQLKLNMENYLKAPVYDDQHHFADFLQTYVDTMYSKRSEFAKDINVTPVFLSQVINKHREPSEAFILKLMIHSEKAFNYVGPFQKGTWYQVYFHEKLCDTMSSQDTWGAEIERQVNLSEAVVNYMRKLPK